MKKPSTLILLLAAVYLTSAETDSLFTRGENYYHQQQFDSAAACFEGVIRQYPAGREGYYNHGLSMYHSGKFAEAIADFEQSIRIDSQFTDAQFMEALALERMGDLDGAIAELEGIKAHNSDYDEVDKRIKNERFAVYIAEKWYYMIAIMLLGIILIGVVVRMFSYRR